jgi:hypothetical protein
VKKMYFEDLDDIEDIDELMKKMNEEEICH